jgi:hypothetical protein
LGDTNHHELGHASDGRHPSADNHVADDNATASVRL